MNQAPKTGNSFRFESYPSCYMRDQLLAPIQHGKKIAPGECQFSENSENHRLTLVGRSRWLFYCKRIHNVIESSQTRRELLRSACLDALVVGIPLKGFRRSHDSRWCVTAPICELRIGNRNSRNNCKSMVSSHSPNFVLQVAIMRHIQRCVLRKLT